LKNNKRSSSIKQSYINFNKKTTLRKYDNVSPIHSPLKLHSVRSSRQGSIAESDELTLNLQRKQ